MWQEHDEREPRAAGGDPSGRGTDVERFLAGGGASATRCTPPPPAGRSCPACAAAFSLLGHRYELGAAAPFDGGTAADAGVGEIPGLGLVDLETIRSDEPRLIGNVAIEVRLEDGEPRVLAGIENHGGRTHLGAGEQPLGRVLKGHGNTGSSGAEGVRRGSVIGTYLHGPLLPKNAWFADRVIRTALGLDELAALDDTLEDAAHAEARRAARV